MSESLLQNLITELSKMSLEEIALLLLRVNQPEAEKLIPKQEPKDIKFYKDIDQLKPYLERQNLKGKWRISNDGLFSQIIFKFGGNINFYKNGTVLIQGSPKIKPIIKSKLEKAIEIFNKETK